MTDSKKRRHLISRKRRQRSVSTPMKRVRDRFDYFLTWFLDNVFLDQELIADIIIYDRKHSVDEIDSETRKAIDYFIKRYQKKFPQD